MRYLPVPLLAALLLSHESLAQSPQAAGGDRNVTLGDCTIEVPEGAKARPEQAWYDTFRQAYDAGQQHWQGAKDAQSWQARERQQMDACAAFKVMIGVCWKESHLNPNEGKGNDAIPSPGMCQIQARNCRRYNISEAELSNVLKNIECAARMMTDILEKDKCITQGADQPGNGPCLTAWSVMISEDVRPDVGHRKAIRQYVTGRAAD